MHPCIALERIMNGRDDFFIAVADAVNGRPQIHRVLFAVGVENMGALTTRQLGQWAYGNRC